MLKRSPSYQWLRLLLSLPSSQRRWACLIGLKREVLTAYNELLEAPQFRALPPRTRRYWVRRQLCRHATGEDVGSNIPGFHPFLLPAESWPRFPDLMLAEGAARHHTILPLRA